ncbi:MAG: sigma-54-dependent Fis family transcriptional regulator [Bdellovibrionaceae bacterium]|nr:sigma-54-dependent Fis family transcriptional regulator [Pseudobdellovibrionaceae bacterium]
MLQPGKSVKPKLAFVDDDPDSRELLRAFFRPRGYEMEFFDHPQAALDAAIANSAFADVLVTDLMLPDFNGVELIRRLRKAEAQLPILLMTAHSSIEIAVEALNEGASDFLIKPLHFPQMELCIMRAFSVQQLHSENQHLREALKEQRETAVNGVIGKSAAFRQACDLAQRVAASTANVLITGETGTGKEVIARLIHRSGERSKGPFIAINCSAIPENLLEGELFGYAKGAFTGAVDRKSGLFEEANGGTLFLDEIGDLPMSLQAKLLRVLQERKIKRLGENQYRDIDVRILAATHKNLQKEVAEGQFREDLFFRLNVIPIQLPALRDRKEDILPLAENMLKKFVSMHGAPVKSFSKETLEFFLSYAWPGNVRELENSVERSVLLCDQEQIQLKHLLLNQSGADANVGETMGVVRELPPHRANAAHDVLTLEELTRRHILWVLERNAGAKDKTARMLGIDRKTLYRKLTEYDASSSVHTLRTSI